jgi:magnesium transporter
VPRFLSVERGHTQETREWPEQHEVLWVDIGPGERDAIEPVVKRFYPVHPLAIHRVLSTGRPNFLVEDDAVVFVLAELNGAHASSPHSDARLAVFLGHRFLVTAHLQKDADVVDQAWQFVRRQQLLDEGPDFALYHVLVGHLRQVKTVVAHLDRDFEALHRTLLEHPYRDLAPHILPLRKQAMAVKRLLEPEVAIFELLKSAQFPYVAAKNRPYFQDATFEMQEIVDEVQATREGLAEMVEAYTSIQSNEINKVMKFLTMISVLALPATTIASIYGMNFNIPELHWKYGYWYSLTLMFLITVAIVVYMRNRDWFQQ